jgi:hypothetical protein
MVPKAISAQQEGGLALALSNGVGADLQPQAAKLHLQKKRALLEALAQANASLDHLALGWVNSESPPDL